mmetsp:Transcript_51421/g.51821  ORF Transcript_51421/g.51821 Transcript_51421/m.51821 type:complete len:82 (-) Transcript_51421:391-636(-)
MGPGNNCCVVSAIISNMPPVRSRNATFSTNQECHVAAQYEEIYETNALPRYYSNAASDTLLNLLFSKLYPRSTIKKVRWML